MDYNFYNFNSQDFENLVQALAQKLLGNNAIIYGLGADGGRELTYRGKAAYPNKVNMWDGYWIIQAKFRARDASKEDNYEWVAQNFRQEMNKFIELGREFPHNYLFFTNAVLTPTNNKGGRDKIEKFKKQYEEYIPHIHFLAYDDICRLLDNNRDVRTAYSHLLTPGDVHEEILRRLGLDPQEIIVAGKEIREKKNNRNTNFLLSDNKSILIGMDFGTSYSLSAYYLKGIGTEYIISDKGQKVVPSIISFLKDGSYIVGKPEYMYLDTDEVYTITNIKRYLGSDTMFKVFNKSYSPEYIASLIIKSLKTSAEEYLGYEIKEVLASQPVNFIAKLKDSLAEIYELAGLRIRRTMSEPSSACMIIDNHYQEGHYLIIDLGGGTLDIAIVEIGDGVNEVKATTGNNRLGGIDFDEVVYSYALSLLKKHIPVIENHHLSFLRYEAERVKKNLRYTDTSSIVVKDIETAEGNLCDFNIEVTKERFRQLSADIVIKFENSLVDLLDSYKHYLSLYKEKIEGVFLTGQGGKIFIINEVIGKCLPNIPIIETYAENAVSMGLAKQSGVLTGAISELLLLDCYNASLSIKCKEIKGTGKNQQTIISCLSSENAQHMTLIRKDTFVLYKSSLSIQIENSVNHDFIDIEVMESTYLDKGFSSLGCCHLPLDCKRNKTELRLTIDVDANAVVIISFKNNETNEENYFKRDKHGFIPYKPNKPTSSSF